MRSPHCHNRRVASKHRDSLGTTLRKTPWDRLAADATLELIPLGTGFAVSLVGGPLGGLAAKQGIKNVLRYLIHRFTHVYESGEVKLIDIITRTIPDARYTGVADFWANVVRDALDTDALVEISGLLSPYGPLMPAHPMSRPGYTVEGWNALGNIEAEDTEEYDTRDGFIYGDRVIRLSKPRVKKYYAGLYDVYFGIANVALPVYVREELVKSTKHELSDLWKHSMATGRAVKLKGRLMRIKNYYEQFAGQLPTEYCTLPSFGLEVSEVEASRVPNGITHISATVSWRRRTEERMLTHYFNVQDRNQFSVAEQDLEETRGNHRKSLLFNYDDIACLSPEWRYKVPEYNEMLRPWLEGQKP